MLPKGNSENFKHLRRKTKEEILRRILKRIVIKLMRELLDQKEENNGKTSCKKTKRERALCPLMFLNYQCVDGALLETFSGTEHVRYASS